MPRHCVKAVEDSGLIFCLTHNYTGYPMVKEARYLIQSGVLGEIRKVIVEYPQGWLSTLVEATGQKQAAWRTDPARSGAAGGLGDIGTHAENLAEYITGLKITEVCADLTIFVEGRLLDDDANVLLRFDNGAKGILQNSQICNGEENDLNIRVYGELGGLEWNQMEPNTLIHKVQGSPSRYCVPAWATYPSRASTYADPGRTPRRLLRGLRQLVPQFCPGRARPLGRQRAGSSLRLPDSIRRPARHEIHRHRTRLGQDGHKVDEVY